MNNKIILGTAQFGTKYGINNHTGKISKGKVFEIFETAILNGIDSLDTAEAYGDCYDLIKEFNLSNNFNFKLYSKLNSKNLHSIKSLNEYLLRSLDYLNQEYFEGYMFHSYEALKNYPYFYDDLLKIKEDGNIKNIGVSVYTNEDLNDIFNNYDQFDFIQAPFNLLDNEIKRKEIFLKLKSGNIKIQVRSVFLQGVFFINPKMFPKKIKPLLPYIETLRKISENLNISIGTMALNYVFNKNYIDQIVIGVDNNIQLKKNLEDLFKKNNFSSTNIDKINVVHEELLNPSNWK